MAASSRPNTKLKPIAKSFLTPPSHPQQTLSNTSDYQILLNDEPYTPLSPEKNIYRDTDSLDLEGQQPDDKTTPLLQSNAAPQEKPDEESLKMKQEVLKKLLQDIGNNTQPIQGLENLIVVWAVIAAAASASTSREFAEKFLKEVVGFENEIVTSGGAIVAGIPQFLLALKSGIERWSMIWRNRKNISMENFKDHWQDILITIFSSLPSANIRLHSKDLQKLFKGHDELRYATAGFTSVSSMGINGAFYMRYKQEQKEKKDTPILNALRHVKKAIHLASDLELIQSLKQNNLIGLLNQSADKEVDPNAIDKIIQAFMALSYVKKDDQHALLSEPSEYWKKFSTCTSSILGCMASMTNWKAALKVTESCSCLPNAADLPSYFTDIINNPLLLATIAIGGVVIGGPSLGVNYLINSIACKNLLTKLHKVTMQEGICNHFKKYTLTDSMLCCFTGVMSVAYGAANGGVAFKYPMLEYSAVAVANAAINGAVFTALGFLSISSFIETVKDKHDQILLLNAFKPDVDLEKYYTDLSAHDKPKFIGLLKKYLNTVQEALVSNFAKTNEASLEKLFSAQTLQSFGGAKVTHLTINTETPIPKSEPITILKPGTKPQQPSMLRVPSSQRLALSEPLRDDDETSSLEEYAMRSLN